MATIKQIDANRRNALKSTGPKTPEGKAAVSMNALRHGLRARSIVLPGENLDEFHQLCGDLEVEWQPQSRSEQFYLEQMAVSQWKLNRMEAGEANLCKEATISHSRVGLLDRLWQAQSRMERSYARAQHELERLQLSRRRQTDDEGQSSTDVPQAPAPGVVAAPAVVGQEVSPAEAPSSTAFSQVKPDPRSAGRPLQASSYNTGVPVACG
jgi:hypothetical protein